MNLTMSELRYRTARRKGPTLLSFLKLVRFFDKFLRLPAYFSFCNRQNCYLKDAFLFCECKRYDVRGKAYFEYPMKYYCEDIGLRNARTGFRQMEMTHIMENIICSELRARDYHVDVGIVYENGKSKSGANIKISREIDFIATKGNKKFYIQSAFAMPDEEKKAIELKPFSLTGDSFPKIVIRQDIGNPWYDDNGFLNISLIDFLLDDSYLN